jgi:hypothetical protein
MGKKSNTVMEKGGLLPSPKTEVYKRIFTAPGRAGKQNIVIGRFLHRGQTAKFNHWTHSLSGKIISQLTPILNRQTIDNLPFVF